MYRRTEGGGMIIGRRDRKDDISPLLHLVSDDTMDSAEILETIDQMRKEKELRRKYEDRIKYRKDGRQVYIYINRMQIVAADEDALYRKLYDIEYGVENYSMAEIFPLALAKKIGTPGGA